MVLYNPHFKHNICKKYVRNQQNHWTHHLQPPYEPLRETNILTNLNHGFRSGFSTETQLLTTVNDLRKSYDKNIQTDMAILDFSKAFDSPAWQITTQDERLWSQRQPLPLAYFFPPGSADERCGWRRTFTQCPHWLWGPQGTVLCPLMFFAEEEMLTLPEQLISPLVFIEVHVALSFVSPYFMW